MIEFFDAVNPPGRAGAQRRAPLQLGVFAALDWKEAIVLSFAAAAMTEVWWHFFVFYAVLSFLGTVRIGAYLLMPLVAAAWGALAYYLAKLLFDHDVTFARYLPASAEQILGISTAFLVIWTRIRTYDMPVSDWITDPQRALSVGEIVFWSWANLDPSTRQEPSPAPPRPDPAPSHVDEEEPAKASARSFAALKKRAMKRTADLRQWLRAPRRRALSSEDAFRAMGLSPDAPRSAIKSRYRELMKEYHPDVLHGLSENEQRKATMRCIDISLAYRTLTQRRRLAG